MFALHFSTARRDLVWVASLTAGVFLLASWLEISEYLLAISRPFEFVQLDEIPLTLLVLSAGLAWFSRRRWLEAKQELHSRIASERELAASREHLRLLTRRGLALQENERRELARELHDELGQYLNAIKIDAVAIRDAAPDRIAARQAAAVSIITLADHAYASVRAIMGRLRPVALDELGLNAALEHLVAGWQSRLPGLQIVLDAAELPVELDEATRMAIYRAVQEGLTNAVRHAAAKCVSVQLLATGAGIFLSIEDDGHGFNTNQKIAGLGLIGMRERVEALGGDWSINSAPDAGCILRITLPPIAGTGS